MNGGGSGTEAEDMIITPEVKMPVFELMTGQVIESPVAALKLKPRMSSNGDGDSPLRTPPGGWSVPNPLGHSTSTASKPLPIIPNLLPEGQSEFLHRTLVKVMQRKSARDRAGTSLLEGQVAAEVRFASGFCSSFSQKNRNNSEEEMEVAKVLSSMKKVASDSPKKAPGPSPQSVASDLFTGGRNNHFLSLKDGEAAAASFVFGPEPHLSFAFEAEVNNADVEDANYGATNHPYKRYKKSF